MWTRPLLKNRAKDVLKKHYGIILVARWMAAVVGLVALLLSIRLALFAAPSYSLSVDMVVPSLTDVPAFDESNSSVEDFQAYFLEFLGNYFSTLLYRMGISVLKSVLLLVALMIFIYQVFKCFVLNVLHVGLCRLAMEAHLITYGAHCHKRPRLRTLFWAFRRGRYLKTVRAMFLYNLYVFLGSLFLVIPGAVLYYKYSYLPYILAEDVDRTVLNMFRLSGNMTQKEKGKLFVLRLSMLGWVLLGVATCGMVTCGTGLIFLAPYIWAVNTALYAAVKDRLFGGQKL